MVWFKKKKYPHLIDTQMSFDEHLKKRGKKIFESEKETIQTVPSRWVDDLRHHKYPSWFVQHRYLPPFGFMLLPDSGLITSEIILAFGQLPKHIYFNWLIDPHFFMMEIEELNEVLTKSPATQFFYWLFNIDDFTKKLHCLALFNNYIQLQTDHKYLMSKGILLSSLRTYPALRERLEKEQYWVDEWANVLEFEDEEEKYKRVCAEDPSFVTSYEKMQDDLQREIYGATVHERVQQYHKEQRAKGPSLTETFNEESTDQVWLRYYLNVLELPEAIDIYSKSGMQAVKKAYKKALQQVHPDKKKWNCSETQLSFIESVYEQLKSWHENHCFKAVITNDLTHRSNERWKDFLDNFTSKYHPHRLLAKRWMPAEPLIHTMHLQEIEIIHQRLLSLCQLTSDELNRLSLLGKALFSLNVNLSDLLSELTQKIRDNSLSKQQRTESLYHYNLLKGFIAVPPGDDRRAKFLILEKSEEAFYKRISDLISCVTHRRQELTDNKEDQPETCLYSPK
jgi:hypothetical protein